MSNLPKRDGLGKVLNIGDRVIYRPHKGGHYEYGVITSETPQMVRIVSAWAIKHAHDNVRDPKTYETVVAPGLTINIENINDPAIWTSFIPLIDSVK